MGILNVTPDSFSDGGRYDRHDAAVEHALSMQAAGASIIDIGGESTRPGAQPVTVEQELERVVPVIEALRRQSDVAISIDTMKPEVMQAAIEAGADMVNDVNALQAEGAVEVCARWAVPVCLMHKQGTPQTMQDNPQYGDVVEEVAVFLQQAADRCIEGGIAADRIMLDPGFGFGKTLENNLSLLKGTDRLCQLPYPVLIGVSRKSMFGMLLGREVDDRMVASVAAAVIAWQKGARLFRVHDVAETCDALKLCEAVYGQGGV